MQMNKNESKKWIIFSDEYFRHFIRQPHSEATSQVRIKSKYPIRKETNKYLNIESTASDCAVQAD